jgi:hypothetical protein
MQPVGHNAIVGTTPTDSDTDTAGPPALSTALAGSSVRAGAASEAPEVSETRDYEGVDTTDGDPPRTPSACDGTGSRDSPRFFCDERRFTTLSPPARITAPDPDEPKPEPDVDEPDDDELAGEEVEPDGDDDEPPDGEPPDGEPSFGDEDPDGLPPDASSAHAAGAPNDTAALTPSATANPPTRPTNRPALTTTSPTKPSIRCCSLQWDGDSHSVGRAQQCPTAIRPSRRDTT